MAQQITSLLDDPTQAVSLDTFSGLTKGCPAPFWLFQGVCGAWGHRPCAGATQSHHRLRKRDVPAAA
ncbi:hypothetical protein [Bifidobacterium moukalabense]|uniref:hypothetical protein n=1 Tax=Bifidobacterium moukalabense TaxID=1333651 RepID=UPI001F40234A|nr:hypothetical protein [Bifidobacterium moukalabense]